MVTHCKKIESDPVQIKFRRWKNEKQFEQNKITFLSQFREAYNHKKRIEIDPKIADLIFDIKVPVVCHSVGFDPDGQVDLIQVCKCCSKGIYIYPYSKISWITESNEPPLRHGEMTLPDDAVPVFRYCEVDHI